MCRPQKIKETCEILQKRYKASAKSEKTLPLLEKYQKLMLTNELGECIMLITPLSASAFSADTAYEAFHEEVAVSVKDCVLV